MSAHQIEKKDREVKESLVPQTPRGEGPGEKEHVLHCQDPCVGNAVRPDGGRRVLGCFLPGRL